ncbi:hypothetical protein AFERRI_400004 [Acidithiobacillus ferrivorans]|uniref:Uncharacterized protein n=1 Tax=Acidithiobacillus ferrivorans TaxID=160808 RepID=A0A060UTU3_9PROT|nr:hypothetical protein AFERRI_400004 [Acidithiobacillus ferrivorans]
MLFVVVDNYRLDKMNNYRYSAAVALINSVDFM